MGTGVAVMIRSLITYELAAGMIVGLAWPSPRQACALLAAVHPIVLRTINSLQGHAPERA